MSGSSAIDRSDSDALPKYVSLRDVIDPKQTVIVSSLDGLLEHLKWSPFTIFVIIVQSVQWAVSAQLFVMTAYLTPAGDTIANVSYKSVRDEWPDEPQYFVWIDTFELIPAAEFAGNFIFGMIPNLLSDRYGRQAALTVVLYGIAIADCACALAPNFGFLIMARFLQGAFLNAITTLNFVHCLESVYGSSRSLACCCFGLFWTLGYCIIAPTALLIGSWRWILGINGIAVLVCALVQSLLVPESQYFCVAHNDIGRLEEFVKTTFLDEHQSHYIIALQKSTSEACAPSHVFCFVRFSSKKVATFIAYAGISFDSTSLDFGDANWIFVLSGLVEFPAYCAASVFLDWFPCKLVMGAVFACASASLLSLHFIPIDLENLYLALWLLSKFFATSCYITSLIVASELFPTKCRATAVGFVLTFSNVGSILAAHFNEALPELSFLISAIVLALATVLVAIVIPMKTKFEQ